MRRREKRKKRQGKGKRERGKKAPSAVWEKGKDRSGERCATFRRNSLAL